MDFDWSDVKIEILGENNTTIFDPTTNNTEEVHQTFQPFKRSRQEMEQEEVYVFEVPVQSDDASQGIVSVSFVPSHAEEQIDEGFDPDDLIEEEIFEDDEDVKPVPQTQYSQYINKCGEMVYVCETCTLDFPSIAYIRRHQNTKKHIRALKMEQRGKKVRQRKKYVRKDEKEGNDMSKKELRKITDMIPVSQGTAPVQKQRQQVMTKYVQQQPIAQHVQNQQQLIIQPVQQQQQEPMTPHVQNIQPQIKLMTQQEIDLITDLTPDEKEFLHFLDDQIEAFNLENTAKNFYENFMDFLEDEPEVPFKKCSTVAEILADLIASSEQIISNQTSYNNGTIVPEASIDLPVIIPQTYQTPAYAPEQQNNQIQYQTSVYHVQEPQYVQTQPQPQVYVNQPMIQVIQQSRVQPPRGQQQKLIIKDDQPKSKIQCKMCPRKFNLRCHLTQHINTVHSGNRNFKCPKCGKKYSTQEILDQHLEKHSGDKPFKCTKCVKSYNNKVDLKRHFKTHDEVKDHICKICGGGFVRSDHLEKHMSVHFKTNRTELGDKIRSRKGLPLRNL